MVLCQFSECDRLAFCKGYCQKHYYHCRRHGILPGPVCRIDGCGLPAYRRGLCNTHALREDRHGDPNVRKKRANGENSAFQCCVSKCEEPGYGVHDGTLYCSVHYFRAKRTGDPLTRRKRANGERTPEQAKAQSRKAITTYYKTAHGRMRRRFSNAKGRVLIGKSKGIGTISKEQFLSLWNTRDCYLCGKPIGDDRTIDHVVPLSRGGSNELSNLRMAHRVCNQRKSNRL